MEKLNKIKELIKNDVEINNILERSNLVMIERMDYNDHGKEHAIIVGENTQILVDLLKDKLTLPTEGLTEEDSKVVVYLAAYLHDLGCSVTREDHELFSAMLGRPIAERLLKEVYGDDWSKLISIVLECISGHMGEYDITSTEAGILAVADACDMTKGRARIPFEKGKRDIHEYSAMAIEKVEIIKGKEKPIMVKIKMKNSAGVFQVELLKKKLKFSGLKKYVEIEYFNEEDNYTESD